MDVRSVFVVGVLVIFRCEAALTNHGSDNSEKWQPTQTIPRCPLGETCMIDQHCKAPNGTSYCVKDFWIKECPAGESLCTLYNGTTGCSKCCDSVPECKDLSDEEPCNKYKCKAAWRMVYEHDSNGNYIAGSKMDLVNDIRKGAEIKMLRGANDVDGADSVLIIGNEICGQSIHHVSTGSWATFEVKAYWWFTIACTTGDFSMSRWYVGDRTRPGDGQMKIGFKWFTRKVEDKYGIVVPANGNDIYAQIQAVKQSAYGVTVKQVSPNTEEYFNADNLEISSDGKSIVAQIVWNILNEKYSNVVKISPLGNWLFHNFASNGQIEVSKYLVGENKRSSVDSSKQSTEWLFDPCWQLAYSHDQNGKGTEGSKKKLIDAIKAGHRVKIMIKNRLSQARNIIINGDVVTAFLPDMLKKSTIEKLEDPAGKWNWMLVNTNGKVETANYLVGESQDGSLSRTTADIKWFIDRREWMMILDVGPKNVNSGSKVHLAYEIKEGADVRYAWISSSGEYTFMEAESIQFEARKSNFGAQTIRSVLLKQHGHEYYFDVSSNKLTWLFTITTNSGIVSSSKWVVGDHVSRKALTTNKRVVWFVAK